ncbi:MAG: enoyl-CoA hydratase/isomerase family protein [Alphaproteobacteria bacterium]
MADYDDIEVTLTGNVALIEIQRPPHNFFDRALILQLADACGELGENADCRAIVLAAQGKSFCAGANFSDGSGQNILKKEKPTPETHLYVEAVRLFSTKKPIVGAIQGAAIGGGLGLALVPDFRVTCPEGRFSANFTRLGFHPGFGLTHTLPALVGQQNATMMMYTGRRIKGEEAVKMGLADVLVPLDQVRGAAMELAAEIAECSPLGVIETRATMRAGLAERVKAATDHELTIQNVLRETDDFKEGIVASSERRVPNFQGR